MKDAHDRPRVIERRHYQPPRFLVEAVDLRFDLHPSATRVTSLMDVRRNGSHRQPLRLDGEDAQLISLKVNGVALAAGDYLQDGATIALPVRGARARIEIVTEINPSANTQLMGLYMSEGLYCTQCEAEGFRRITWFPDRPDVMSRYTVTIVADKATAPVLLANGNPVASGEEPDGRHWVRWVDPFPKPCYLFALVAGDLSPFRDRFTTRSGRDVALAIWVKAGDLDRCGHAMAALKTAMRWDEERFGREYDLDIYNIVAVSDYNFGAMENKGLNIFNSKYVLAKSETATDADFDAIESVIAHEYFHNWTGNRITCRDWFQLSLKEGLTVFRDQEFSADVGSRGLKRIEDVRLLRAAQFPEDSGPLAHPVRPDSYIEISNFYTATIYNKGAEIIRMLETLLGREGFRKGMDLYFERHDGQAVTCDDFLAAMADATGADLGQFALWYGRVGTPVIEAVLDHDTTSGTATLELRQTLADGSGGQRKEPLHIPVRMALFDRSSGARLIDDHVLELTQSRQQFRFFGLARRPVVSLLRGFSAPVILKVQRESDELAFLATHDDDPFARYEATQQLYLSALLDQIAGFRVVGEVRVPAALVDVVANALADEDGDPALIAEALLLPTEAYIGDQMAQVDVDAIHQVRQAFRRALATALEADWRRIYRQCHDAVYRWTPDAKARRRLKAVALGYCLATDSPEAAALAWEQFSRADNMTDRVSALTALASSNSEYRLEALTRFYHDWRDDPLVIDKWFAIQAMANRSDTLQQVLTLSRHPAFTQLNPNRLRALVGSFSANQAKFHDVSGAGYAFLVDQVLAIDQLNSQTAARLLMPLGRWRRFDGARAVRMRAQLERVAARSTLSKDVYEVVTRSLEPERGRIRG